MWWCGLADSLVPVHRPGDEGMAGELAAEDLVSMFHEMGVETGLDLPAVIEAAREAQSVLSRKLTSHSLVAGPVHWHQAVS